MERLLSASHVNTKDSLVVSKRYTKKKASLHSIKDLVLVS